MIEEENSPNSTEDYKCEVYSWNVLELAFNLKLCVPVRNSEVKHICTRIVAPIQIKHIGKETAPAQVTTNENYAEYWENKHVRNLLDASHRLFYNSNTNSYRFPKNRDQNDQN